MATLSDLLIRQANIFDVQQITTVWLEGVSQQDMTVIGYEDASAAFLTHVRMQDLNFKFWVCEDNMGQIIGWQSILPFHATPHPLVRNGFAQSSTYVQRDHRHTGVGKMLLQHALDYCTSSTSIKYVCVGWSSKNGQ